jgi:hypothetical protein
MSTVGPCTGPNREVSSTTVQGWVNLDGPMDNDLHFAYYAHVAP